MPSCDTFTIPPVHDLLKQLCHGRTIDPFARNSKITEWSNDLNTETSATFHLDAPDFMDLMVAEGQRFDVCLLDPPYSPRQISECYKDIGRKVTQTDTQISPMYNRVKDAVDKVLGESGLVISFGWQSGAMGTGRGYDIVQILLIAHGGHHNDTICTVEKKRGLVI